MVGLLYPTLILVSKPSTIVYSVCILIIIYTEGSGIDYYIYSLSVHFSPVNPSLQTHVDDGHVAPFIQPCELKQGFSERKKWYKARKKDVENFILKCVCIFATFYFLLAV